MKKILVFILAYNAERHIVGLLRRLPEQLWNNKEYITEVVVIDDCSKDNTSRIARQNFANYPYPIRLLRNVVNQGYGGNQKVGYTYAIEHGYDVVVMLHGDGQYPPEKIPDMAAPLIRKEADAVFGSHMLHKKDAIRGGMPLYKFAGNIILTALQNRMLGSALSEFHTGFRAYSVKALRQIPFQYNSDVFHFDTDIIIQFTDCGLSIQEIPIPTHYGDEVCHVNGTRYALDVLVSTLVSRVQKLGIFYTPKFDYNRLKTYDDKSGFASSHRFALDQIAPGNHVLDLSCDGGILAPHVKAQGCTIDYCGPQSDAMRGKYDSVFDLDLHSPDFAPLTGRHYDFILLPDIISRLPAPEYFLAGLHAYCVASNPKVVITAPNIAFFIQRFMLLMGQFNYGRHGILDMTHMRLFTFSSLHRLLANAGFNAITAEGIPAPFPLAVGENWLGRWLLKLNRLLIAVSESLFSYQIAMVAKPRPTLKLLVEQAIKYGEDK